MHFLFFQQRFQKLFFLRLVEIWLHAVKGPAYMLFYFNCETSSTFYFNPFPKKPWFLRVCSTSLLKKNSGKRRNLLITSNFSCSHNVFYPSDKLPAILINFQIVLCKFFQLGRVSKLSFRKELRILDD